MKILEKKGSFLPSIVILLLPWVLSAQGPRISYYYNPATELSFASCYVYQHGGSKQKIPFMPVVDRNTNAPLGIENYSKDVDVNGRLVFIGNGIVKEGEWNSYTGRRRDYSIGDLDVTGKIVLFCYDFSDSVEKKWGEAVSLSERISEAASRKAAAVILFSRQTDHPFLYVDFETTSCHPEIPVITITEESARNILSSSGSDGAAFIEEWENTDHPPRSEMLISFGAIKIKGRFDRVETKNFSMRFRKEVIPEKEMKQIARVNDKAVEFLLNCLQEDGGLNWNRIFALYFRDFDSKIFYTHRTGRGFADIGRVCMIHEGGVPSLRLAVHENMHILAYSNWSENSTSFMDEGIAKYTEALATEKDKNHLQTAQFLNEKVLFPLEEMVAFNIGSGGLETLVAYPASGSFTGFLIETYGLKSFKEVFLLEARSYEERQDEKSWEKAYGKPLHDLEKEWLAYLIQKGYVDEQVVRDHLVRVEEQKRLKQEQQEAALPIHEWKIYAGRYSSKEVGQTFDIQVGDNELIVVSLNVPDMILHLSPEGRHCFIFKDGPAVGERLVFELNEKDEIMKLSIGSYNFIRE